jgi:anti-sigma regulatory factor (Ser/Thr protein kinase)
MDNRQEVVVRRDFDVIVARSRVRDLARWLGMGATDQARISLATSSAARTMGLGGPHRGQIVFEGLNDGERIGVRVVCTANNGASDESHLGTFSNIRFMTDELSVEKLPSNETRVTMVKWDT